MVGLDRAKAQGGVDPLGPCVRELVEGAGHRLVVQGFWSDGAAQKKLHVAGLEEEGKAVEGAPVVDDGDDHREKALTRAWAALFAVPLEASSMVSMNCMRSSIPRTTTPTPTSWESTRSRAPGSAIRSPASDGMPPRSTPPTEPLVSMVPDSVIRAHVPGGDEDGNRTRRRSLGGARAGGAGAAICLAAGSLTGRFCKGLRENQHEPAAPR